MEQISVNTIRIATLYGETMKDIITRNPIPHPPAVVPQACSDGLLKTADLNDPVAVEVEVWRAAENGYTVRLNLDGIPITEERVITTADKPGNILTLFIAPNFLRDQRTYQLQYRTYSPQSGVEDFSPSVALKVDRTPAGAALLAPMIFPNTDPDAHAIALVPGYAGMETGDTLHTLCNGVPGPTHTVQPDELTVRPIEIRFEQDFLLSLGAQSVVIDYSVTDRAGNNSIRSLPTTLEMAL